MNETKRLMIIFGIDSLRQNRVVLIVNGFEQKLQFFVLSELDWMMRNHWFSLQLFRLKGAGQFGFTWGLFISSYCIHVKLL